MVHTHIPIHTSTYPLPRTPDPLPRDRFKSIYPLYLASLLTAGALNSYMAGRNFSLGTPFETVTSVLLLQAWIPTVTEHVLQDQCW